MEWEITWRRGGEVTGSVAYNVIYADSLPCALRFQYSISSQSQENRENLDYLIKVISTPCHLGGIRWWFFCPLVVNGKLCERRCRILYLPRGEKYWGCRECHKLSYESRQNHRSKFYEELVKPLADMKALEAILNRPVSAKRVEKLLRRYESAQLKLLSYANNNKRREGK